MAGELVTINQAQRILGVSRSTIWRRIQRGYLPSIRRGARRLVPASALRTYGQEPRPQSIQPFSENHPMFRLVGAGRSGGKAPSARNKHAILVE
jgi:excisionase family DNA binding protein